MYEQTQHPSLHLLRKIESLCTQFEAALQNGEQPDIREYLPQLETSQREELFFELLCIEIDYGRKNGQARSPSDYRQRFSEFEPAIIQAFAETAVHPTETLPATVTSDVTSPSADVRLQPGDVFAGNTIVRQLGQGGMGVVYLARQSQTGRLLALKVMRSALLEASNEANGQGAKERFFREVRALGRLSHPHIVSIYEAGQHDGQPFYSMGHVEGDSLRELLAHGPLEPARCARYLQQAADGIHTAHEASLTHRDISPGNILIHRETDTALVSDFGLAKISGEPSQTLTGAVFGSPYYMAPEQVADASRADKAADIYSLGATLYHALTGRPPFQAVGAMETLMQVVREEPAAPRTLNPDVPRDLENICLKCLQKQPQQRYDSAAALSADLQRFLAGKPVSARPIRLPVRALRWMKRNPLPAAFGGIAVLALLAGSITSAAFAVEAFQQAKAAVEEKERTVIALREARRQRGLAVEKQQQATAATAEAVKQSKLAAHQLLLARKSAANQLRLYVRPSEIAGEIATASSAKVALARLDSLTSGASSIQNGKLADAIRAVRDAIESDPQQFASTSLAQRLNMPAAVAARQLSAAAYATWQKECNAYFGSIRSIRPAFLPSAREKGEPPTTVVELEYEILTAPLYEELQTSVKTIATPLPDNALPADAASYLQAQRQFWQIYWGRLVFASSPEVMQQATAFAENLANGPADQRQQHAEKLLALCQKYGG